MTTDHLHPNDQRPEENSGPFASSFPESNGAAKDIQSMQTRLADLLDQVSVAAPETDAAFDVPALDSFATEEKSQAGGYFTSQNGSRSSEPSRPNDSFGDLDSSWGAPPSVSINADQDSSDYRQSGANDSSISSFASAEPLSTRLNDTTNGSFGTARPDTGLAEKSIDTPILEDTPVESGERTMPDEIGRGTISGDVDVSASSDDGTNGAITIKGRSDGIAIEIGAGSWRMLMVQLRHRLQQSAGFFRGGAVSLDVGERALTDEELATAKEILNEHGLNLNLVRSISEETSQASSALGVPISLEQAEGTVAESANTNHESLEHFVYRGNLRSGQVLRRSETILVLGDVNPGAHIESEGDILVWGRLRGIAHAGAHGDTNAIVSAMLMEPTQLRISDSIAIMPSTEERRSLFGAKKRNPDLAPRPEVAYVSGGSIVVEPWDESKPGGIMAFRRS